MKMPMIISWAFFIPGIQEKKGSVNRLLTLYEKETNGTVRGLTIVTVLQSLKKTER
jgi:hypothetical protein